MKLFLLLLLCANIGDSYKVLIYNPIFGHSHTNYMGKLADILQGAGNDVTLLNNIIMEEKKGFSGSKLVKDVVTVELGPKGRKKFSEMESFDKMRKKMWTISPNVFAMMEFMSNFSALVSNQCDDMFSQTQLLADLKDRNYDLAISEPVFICGFALFDQLGIKTTISADSTVSFEAVREALGEPAAYSYSPATFSSQNDDMNLLGRAKNAAETIVGGYFLKWLFGEELKTIKEQYTNAKSWQDLINKNAFVFINSNPYIDFPRPNLHKTVYVGGMQVNTKTDGTGTNKLDKEWDDVLSQRKTNVLISFGSNAYTSDMPDSYKESLLKVFESLPDTTFILKYEVDSNLTSHLKNVHLTKWMPQNALLADPRLTVFVTHGGLGSTIELAYTGKAAVMIPLGADQPRNALMLARHGGAIVLQKSDLDNAEKIEEAIKTVVADKKYAENAQRVAKMLREQPYDPKDVVLRHCDFAVKFGNLETLDSRGRNLNFIQNNLLDVLAIVVVVIVIVGLIIRSIFRFCLRKCSKKTKTD